jgi:hypothetical protein
MSNIKRVISCLMIAAGVAAAANQREEKLGAVTFRGAITNIDPKEEVTKAVLAITGRLKDDWIITIQNAEKRDYRCDMPPDEAVRLWAGDQVTVKGELYRHLELSYEDENGKHIYPGRNVYRYAIKKCKITDQQHTNESVTGSVTGSLVSKFDLPDQNGFEFVIKDFVDGVLYTCSGAPLLRIYSEYKTGDTISVAGGASLPRNGRARINSCHVVSHGPSTRGNPPEQK